MIYALKYGVAVTFDTGPVTVQNVVGVEDRGPTRVFPLVLKDAAIVPDEGGAPVVSPIPNWFDAFSAIGPLATDGIVFDPEVNAPPVSDTVTMVLCDAFVDKVSVSLFETFALLLLNARFPPPEGNESVDGEIEKEIDGPTEAFNVTVFAPAATICSPTCPVSFPVFIVSSILLFAAQLVMEGVIIVS